MSVSDRADTGAATPFQSQADALGETIKQHGGLSDPEKRNEWGFPTASAAREAARALDQPFPIPEGWSSRPARLAINKAGRLCEYIAREADDQQPEHWDAKGKRWWHCVVGHVVKVGLPKEQIDKVIRLLIRQGISTGWMLRTEEHGWAGMSGYNVRLALQNTGMDKTDAEALMGGCCRRPWNVVCRHFEPEYPEPAPEPGKPGKRVWNLDGAQFRYEPQEGKHPHWDRVLTHVGGGEPGSAWLLSWIAAMFQYPYERLPYIFLFGPEDCGKSIFHESLELLVDRGVVAADRFLGKTEFNGEMAKAILCFVEEKNIAESPGSLEKIKNWVTSPKVAIRKMQTDQFMVDNATHWVQCANAASYCPVFPGDTRISVFEVQHLLPEQIIAKPILKGILKTEAPAFLHTVLNFKLPEPSSRLLVPVWEGEAKQKIQDANTSDHAKALAEWLGDQEPGEGETLWKGNTSALKADYAAWTEAKAQVQHPVVWPRDGRSVVRLIDEASPYLASRKIANESGRNEKGVVITFRRAA